ncbi:MAG: TrkH family potassium uptake protein [Spirochaetaceae bacterium]|jgi:trk system potassium uptake protein TrkH|nr:TrkH family potassium uptake protein [Spirochaetaceae bacterium]
MRKLKLLRIPLFVQGILAPMLIPPILYALLHGETRTLPALVFPALIALALSIPALFLIARRPVPPAGRDGFFLVSMTWIFLSLLGSLPYYLSGEGIRFTDAVFESVCGFASTGATSIPDTEALPRSLLLWRAISHWTGGIGIIMLTVALLPLLGVGGFQLVKAETAGPEKERITPKITQTAKVLSLVYLSFTLALFLLYLSGGMDSFDAACNALSILATGGVSTKNEGLRYYNSAYIDTVTTVFMLLAGFNFNMYFRILRGKIKDVFYNTEARAYLLIFAVSCLLIAVNIFPLYASPFTALRYAAFQSASILSTTGNAAANYEKWPAGAQAVLFALMFIGGCSGSTACGVKVIRHAVLWKQGVNELRRMIYPRGVFSVRLNNKIGRKDVVYGVAGFMFLYFSIVFVTTFVTAASGVDLFTSFSAALSILGNVGTGFGGIGPAQNYGFFSDGVKWLFCFVMIAGRLEIWTVLVMFTPGFWRT